MLDVSRVFVSQFLKMCEDIWDNIQSFLQWLSALHVRSSRLLCFLVIESTL